MGKVIRDRTEEKWITHYSSSHKILLVGEGDFSFSACLARAFGSGVNMVATSLESRKSLLRKYSLAQKHLVELEQLGCSIFHRVDAKSMSQFPSLAAMSFDRIIFNFPHSGFPCIEDSKLRIKLHRYLVRGFLRNARSMLRENGEIHITHKTSHPFSLWKIVELAEEVGLRLFKEWPFHISHYPLYENKRGSGCWIDDSFPIGACSTFIFKWITHYSSSHKILLVGEGDFSFSACLARAFGSGVNMVATSLDSRKSLLREYSFAQKYLEELKLLGCSIFHRVDAKSMSIFPPLATMSFDRIIFNFPHAGFLAREHSELQIELHRYLVRGFLRNARSMLRENGEIHITHKTSHPFRLWKIVELAEEVGLRLVKEWPFHISHYPLYKNKRGSGCRIDDSFPVGACSTFMFKLAEKMLVCKNKRGSDCGIDESFPVGASSTFMFKSAEKMLVCKNKRGSDCGIDESFPVEASSTFMFKSAEKMLVCKDKRGSDCGIDESFPVEASSTFMFKSPEKMLVCKDKRGSDCGIDDSFPVEASTTFMFKSPEKMLVCKDKRGSDCGIDESFPVEASTTFIFKSAEKKFVCGLTRTSFFFCLFLFYLFLQLPPYSK